jgi:hypothetical protein
LIGVIPLDGTFTLRQMAEIIAESSGDPDTLLDFYHQVFRGWSQRGVLTGKRTGAGKTSPLVFTLEDICRVRILLAFREAFGTDGDELRNLNERIAHYRKTVATMPKGRTFSLLDAIKGIPKGEDWWLRVYFVRHRETKIQEPSFYISPLKFLPDLREAYKKDAQLALVSVTDINLSEVLAGVIESAANA